MLRRTILVAVDGSKPATYALNWAIKNFIRPNDKTLVLYASPQPEMPYLYVGAGPYSVTPDLLETVKLSADRQAQLIRTKYHKICARNNLNFENVVASGNACDQIMEAIEKNHVDCLVMASRGHNAFKRFFLGSTSSFCVHHAPCPVIVVKPKPEESEEEVTLESESALSDKFED